MKKRLAVFDFDKTIADFSVDIDGEIEAHKILFADGQIPSDFKDLKTDLNAGNAVRSYKIKTLNERNLTKDQVWNIFEQIDEESRALIEGMDKVLKYLYEDHDIILLSDNDTLTPSVFLSRYGLLKYFSDLFARKMTIAQDGQLSFEDIPRTSCPLGGYYLCKGQVLLDYIKDKNYEKVSYFGDGGNDYCPATKLTESDNVFPRKDLALDLKIQETAVRAKVCPWNNGIDLLPLLKQ